MSHNHKQKIPKRTVGASQSVGLEPQQTYHSRGTHCPLDWCLGFEHRPCVSATRRYPLCQSCCYFVNILPYARVFSLKYVYVYSINTITVKNFTQKTSGRQSWQPEHQKKILTQRLGWPNLYCYELLFV